MTTVTPGQPAWVSSTFDGTDVHLTFGIPEGYPGAQGQQGEPGPQGPPGEVTSAQLSCGHQRDGGESDEHPATEHLHF